ATTMGAQRGLLIRNAEGLEIAKDVHTVVFDKTGTLTRGEFGVSDVIALGGWSETDLLRIAAAVERNSEHVIAKAIVARSESQSLGRRTSSTSPRSRERARGRRSSVMRWPWG